MRVGAYEDVSIYLFAGGDENAGYIGLVRYAFQRLRYGLFILLFGVR